MTSLEAENMELKKRLAELEKELAELQEEYNITIQHDVGISRWIVTSLAIEDEKLVVLDKADVKTMPLMPEDLRTKIAQRLLEGK